MAKSDEILKQIGGLGTSVGVLNTKVEALDGKIDVCNAGIAAQVRNNKEQWKAINRQEHKSAKVEARHDAEDKQDKATEVKMERRYMLYAALIGGVCAVIGSFIFFLLP